MIIKNLKIKNLLIFSFFIFILLSLIFLGNNVKGLTIDQDISQDSIIKPKPDDFQGPYDFSVNFDGNFPTHYLHTTNSIKDPEISFFKWFPDGNEGNSPELYMPILITDNFPREESNSILEKSEVNEFIFRHPFDNVNLFGGGYSIFADFYNFSPITQDPSLPEI